MSDAYDEPEGVNPRGTVIVAAGRGETTSAYARLGRRLAADGYRVRIPPDITADLGLSLAATEKLPADGALPAPKVLIGSDTGALFARSLAARRAAGLDALVLAALPATRHAAVDQPHEPNARPAAQRPHEANARVAAVERPHEAKARVAAVERPHEANARVAAVERPHGIGGHATVLDWPHEVEARTACPTHQRVLGEDAAVPGALFSTAIPASPAPTGEVTLPALGLHGDADTISPLAQVRPFYPGTLVAIAGGRHDVLNDLSHRTVAATIVLFLERLRPGADLPAIARRLSPGSEGRPVSPCTEGHPSDPAPDGHQAAPGADGHQAIPGPGGHQAVPGSDGRQVSSSSGGPRPVG